MRYGNPSTRSKVREMVEKGCQKIVFFPLYPQYAGATTATANDQFFRALMEEKWQPTVRTVPAYFDDPVYIDALAQSVERAYAALDHEPDMLVGVLPRRAQALPDGGRSLPLPVPEDDAPAARAAGLGRRTESSPPSRADSARRSG